MRPLLPALLALVLLAPRPAAACCADSPCPATNRWRSLTLRTEGPLPRDGVLVFSGATGNDLCSAALAPLVTIDVTRGDQPIPGALELADGRGDTFVWRPDAPWEPGAHHVHLEIDNDAIAPPPDPSPEDPGGCPTDCPDVPLVVLDADFAVGPEFSPPIPPLPSPLLALELTRFRSAITDITCCPGVLPSLSCCGSCSVVWEGAGCVELHEQGRMTIAVPPHPLPPELAAQLVYELRGDGLVLDRRLDPEGLAEFASRLSPACVQVSALHLGNGQTLASETVCPPAPLVQQLGVHPVDVLAELACDAPVLCGQPNGTWDPDACVAFDPLAPPPPPSPDPDPISDAPCPPAQGPWLSPETDDDPTTSAATDAASSGTADPASAGDEVLVDHGCACTHGPAKPPALLLLLAPLLLRRRRLR